MSKSVSKTDIGEVSVGQVGRAVVITNQQLRILLFIYRFRFVSTAQLQFVLGKKQIQQVQQRLNLLVTRGWIGRNFSKLDRLTGKYASYYLLPNGMKVLKQQTTRTGYELDQRAVHNIYKDKTASERFIIHCLSVGDIYCNLKRMYGGELEYFSKSELTSDEYFPKPRPDVFFRATGKTAPNAKQEFFLDYCEEVVPFFVYRNRVKYYGEYEDEETWEEAVDTKLPTILLVAETPRLQRRLLRYLKRYLENSYADDLRFLVTSKELLAIAKPESPIWSEYDEDEEMTVLRAL